MLACGFFIYRMGQLFRVGTGNPPAPGVQVFTLYGALFFGAVAKVEAVGQGLPADTQAVVLRMPRLISIDSSGIDALAQLHRALGRQGVALHLCELNEQPFDLLQRSGLLADLGPHHVHADLASALAVLRPAAPGGPSDPVAEEHSGTPPAP